MNVLHWFKPFHISQVFIIMKEFIMGQNLNIFNMVKHLNTSAVFIIMKLFLLERNYDYKGFGNMYSCHTSIQLHKIIFLKKKNVTSVNNLFKHYDVTCLFILFALANTVIPVHFVCIDNHSPLQLHEIAHSGVKLCLFYL